VLFPFELSKERRGADAELSRRSRLVPAEPPQHAQDVLVFAVGQRTLGAGSTPRRDGGAHVVARLRKSGRRRRGMARTSFCA
jgi:hypothetical protein